MPVPNLHIIHYLKKYIFHSMHKRRSSCLYVCLSVCLSVCLLSYDESREMSKNIIMRRHPKRRNREVRTNLIAKPKMFEFQPGTSTELALTLLLGCFFPAWKLFSLLSLFEPRIFWGRYSAVRPSVCPSVRSKSNTTHTHSVLQPEPSAFCSN